MQRHASSQSSCGRVSCERVSCRQTSCARSSFVPKLLARLCGVSAVPDTCPRRGFRPHREDPALSPWKQPGARRTFRHNSGFLDRACENASYGDHILS
ncbi:hypothetical protein BASA81_003405 [Batrachochytrium salamandrivorans]|nr:hypothetical protein BASA81_003405 [Batrachochytrium salamandrivorans]